MPVPTQIRRKTKPVAIRETDGMKIWAYNDKGQPICNAQSSKYVPRMEGKRCQSVHVVSPSGRCKYHGGHTRHGLTHQSFKTGEYSQYLPPSMRKRFKDFMEDPDYLSLRVNVNVTKTRLTEILEGINNAIDRITLKRLRYLGLQFQKALKEPDLVKSYNKLASLAEIVVEIAEEGKDISIEWDEYFKSQNHLKELIVQEQRRLEASSKQLTAEEAWLVITKVVWAVKENVEDPMQLSAIANAIDRILDESLIPSQFARGMSVPALPSGEPVERFPEYEDEEEL